MLKVKVSRGRQPSSGRTPRGGQHILNVNILAKPRLIIRNIIKTGFIFKAPSSMAHLRLKMIVALIFHHRLVHEIKFPLNFGQHIDVE